MNILTNFDGLDRPITAPRFAAAYAVSLDREKKTATVIFRLKGTHEGNALVTLLAARKEAPGFTWQPVPAVPTAMNSGGVEKGESPYRMLKFTEKDGNWTLDGDDLDQFATAMNKITVTAPDLPESARVKLQQIMDLVKK